MENLEVVNSLECRICLSTYRLFFVENTEDYLCRHGKLAAAAKFSRRKSKDRKKTDLANLINKKFGKIISATGGAANNNDGASYSVTFS